MRDKAKKIKERKERELKEKLEEEKKSTVKTQRIVIVILIIAIVIASVILIVELFFDKGRSTSSTKPESHETSSLDDSPSEVITDDEDGSVNLDEDSTEEIPTITPVNQSSYNVNIIKEFNKISNRKNYLLSPYNIEIALNMLREGADGHTKEELDNVLGERVINDVSLDGIVGIANALFIRDIYKDSVNRDFYTTIDKKYHSELIYDSFTTPTKINNWVKVKTNGMIDKLLDRIDSRYVMGLASALAIDVKWAKSFDCINTTQEAFTKMDSEKINVEMMHNTYVSNASYFNTKDAKGIVIPYAKEDNSKVQLEFVGILPNSDVDYFVNNLTTDKLDDILNNQKEAGENLKIMLSLPRFKYDYTASNFIKVLNNLGIVDIFDSNEANFQKMINEKVYVGEAIHKTHIELNELGTKAAAITYFGLNKSSVDLNENMEKVEIKFDKPFAYMIRERNTGEILFFGVVFEPNIWNGQTCSNSN